MVCNPFKTLKPLLLDIVDNHTYKFILVVLEGAAPQILYSSISVLVAHHELSFVGGDQWQRDQ